MSAFGGHIINNLLTYLQVLRPRPRGTILAGRAAQNDDEEDDVDDKGGGLRTTTTARRRVTTRHTTTRRRSYSRLTDCIGAFLSLLSPRLTSFQVNWPSFVWTAVIGRSHSELGRVRAVTRRTSLRDHACCSRSHYWWSWGGVWLRSRPRSPHSAAQVLPQVGQRGWGGGGSPGRCVGGDGLRSLI